jgi:hypothetical protein
MDRLTPYILYSLMTKFKVSYNDARLNILTVHGRFMLLCFTKTV